MRPNAENAPSPGAPWRVTKYPFRSYLLATITFVIALNCAQVCCSYTIICLGLLTLNMRFNVQRTLPRNKWKPAHLYNLHTWQIGKLTDKIAKFSALGIVGAFSFLNDKLDPLVGPDVTFSYAGNMYDVDGVSIGANPPFHGKITKTHGPNFSSVVSWQDGGTLVVRFTADTDSADIVGDVQVFGPVYACSTGLKAKDGTNTASVTTSWDVGDVVTVVVTTTDEDKMRIGRLEPPVSLRGVMIGDSFTLNGNMISAALEDSEIKSLVNAGVQGHTLTQMNARKAAALAMYCGDNLVPNGEFASGVTGWTLGSATGAIEHDATTNKLKLTNTTTSNAWMYSPAITVEPNTTYELTFSRHSSSTCPDALIWIGITGTPFNNSVMASTGLLAVTPPWKKTFTTGSGVTTIYIGFQHYSGSIGQFSLLDSIGVRKAAPPTFVAIQGGINDINSGASLASMQTALDALVESVRGAGAYPAVLNPGPFLAMDATKQGVLDSYLSWVSGYCAQNVVPFVDLYTLVVDPTTPHKLNPTYDSGDGVHLNTAGYVLVGQALAAAIKAAKNDVLVGPWSPFDSTMPALSISTNLPGSLLEVQEWSAPVSAEKITSPSVNDTELKLWWDNGATKKGTPPAYPVETLQEARGLWGGPAVTQMLKNSRFDGAVSGSPGTPPTNWSQIFTAPGSYVINGQALTMSASAGRTVFFQDFSALANTLYYLQLSLVVTACSSALDEIAVVSGLPTGATLSRFVDGASALGSVVLTPGVHQLKFVISISATAGTPRVLFGVGCISTGTAIVEFEKPMLSTVKTAPYIATGPNETITQPSAAATTGGNGASIAMDQRILEAFRGKPDGVELCTTGTFESGDAGWFSYQATKEIQDGKLKVTVTTVGGGHAYYSVPATVGERFLFSADVTTTCAVQLRAQNGTGNSITSASSTRLSAEVTATDTYVLFLCFVSADVGQSALFDNISIQRLAPAVCTVMHEAYMGVGSVDLVEIRAHSFVTFDNTETTLLYNYGGPTQHPIVRSYDAVTTVNTDLVSTWSPNEIHRRYVQTNATGTKFRVGYQRFTAEMLEITNGIVWSHATADAGANFDGSFNPLQWLRFGLNLTVPIWHRGYWVSQSSLDDYQIAKANALMVQQ